MYITDVGTSEDMAYAKVKTVIGNLYSKLNIDQYQLEREQELVRELEDLKLQLAPLEEVSNLKLQVAPLEEGS